MERRAERSLRRPPSYIPSITGHDHSHLMLGVAEGESVESPMTNTGPRFSRSTSAPRRDGSVF